MANKAPPPRLAAAIADLEAAYATRDAARATALATVDRQHAALITRRLREYQAAHRAAKKEGINA